MGFSKCQEKPYCSRKGRNTNLTTETPSGFSIFTTRGGHTWGSQQSHKKNDLERPSNIPSAQSSLWKDASTRVQEGPPHYYLPWPSRGGMLRNQGGVCCWCMAGHRSLLAYHDPNVTKDVLASQFLPKACPMSGSKYGPIAIKSISIKTRHNNAHTEFHSSIIFTVDQWYTECCMVHFLLEGSFLAFFEVC